MTAMPRDAVEPAPELYEPVGREDVERLRRVLHGAIDHMLDNLQFSEWGRLIERVSLTNARSGWVKLPLRDGHVAWVSTQTLLKLEITHSAEDFHRNLLEHLPKEPTDG